MRNRLNVSWNGKRTTARFPAYLWLLALRASQLTDDGLRDYMIGRLGYEDQSGLSGLTASEETTMILVSLISIQLPPIAFNRDPKQPESAFRDGK